MPMSLPETTFHVKTHLPQRKRDVTHDPGPRDSSHRIERTTRNSESCEARVGVDAQGTHTFCGVDQVEH